MGRWECSVARAKDSWVIGVWSRRSVREGLAAKGKKACGKERARWPGSSENWGLGEGVG